MTDHKEVVNIGDTDENADWIKIVARKKRRNGGATVAKLAKAREEDKETFVRGE